MFTSSEKVCPWQHHLGEVCGVLTVVYPLKDYMPDHVLLLSLEIDAGHASQAGAFLLILWAYVGHTFLDQI